MLRDVRRRLGGLPAVLLLGGVFLLGACGEPPAPPQTAPPVPTGSPSLSVPSSAPVSMPVIVPTTMPTAGIPVATVPTVPTYPGLTPTTTYSPPIGSTTTPTTTTTHATPGTSPAPKCTGGPTKEQLIAVVEGTAGIPDEPLTVIKGPFCSGTWQFSVMEIAESDAEDSDEELSVVTTGKPASLTLIEAGTDVCSGKVQNDAPAGIRVLACGA